MIIEQKSSNLVSIILAVNKGTTKLNGTIESILNQTYSNIELIIIFNGPKKILLKKMVNKNHLFDKRLKVRYSNVNYLNFCLSLGVNYAKGDLIARIDDGDIAKKNRIEEQVSYFKKNSKLGVVGTNYEIINENDKIINKIVLPLCNKDIRKKLYYTNPICHPSVMVRKKLIISCGGYVGGLFAEDYDLWLNILYFTDYEFCNIEKILLYYREHGNEARGSREAYISVSTSQIKMFLRTFDFRWLIGFFLTNLKFMLKKNQLLKKLINFK